MAILFSIVAAPIYIPTNYAWESPFLQIFYQCLLSFFFFLIIATLTDVRWYLIVVLVVVTFLIKKYSIHIKSTHRRVQFSEFSHVEHTCVTSTHMKKEKLSSPQRYSMSMVALLSFSSLQKLPLFWILMVFIIFFLVWIVFYIHILNILKF